MFRCMYCMYWVRLFLCVPFLYLGWSGSRPVGDLHSQVSPGEHDSSSQVLVGWPKHQFFHLTLDLDSIWKQWACFTWKTIAQTYPVRSSYFFVNQYLWFQYTCSPSCNQVNATTQVSLIFAHWLFGLWWHIQYGTWIDDRVMGQAGWVHTNISCDYIYILPLPFPWHFWHRAEDSKNVSQDVGRQGKQVRKQPWHQRPRFAARSFDVWRCWAARENWWQSRYLKIISDNYI